MTMTASLPLPPIAFSDLGWALAILILFIVVVLLVLL